VKLVACDRAKANAIAGNQQRWLRSSRIEDGERRSANQIPAAGRLERVDARLISTDPDGARGYSGTR
jgi:hypothetical protein